MKQYRKLVVAPMDGRRTMMDLLCESDGVNGRTVRIIRTRPATAEEELVYLTGYGSHLNFDAPRRAAIAKAEG